MTAKPTKTDLEKVEKVELGGKIGDAFARYTRPRLVLKLEGDRTCLVNLPAVARAVGLPPLRVRTVCEVLLKHFSLRLGSRGWVAQSESKSRHEGRPGGEAEDALRFLLAGRHEAAKLENLLGEVERRLACCSTCGAAELRLSSNGRRKAQARLLARCAACGATAQHDPADDKLVAHLLVLLPKPTQ